MTQEQWPSWELPNPPSPDSPTDNKKSWVIECDIALGVRHLGGITGVYALADPNLIRHALSTVHKTLDDDSKNSRSSQEYRQKMAHENISCGHPHESLCEYLYSFCASAWPLMMKDRLFATWAVENNGKGEQPTTILLSGCLNLVAVSIYPEYACKKFPSQRNDNIKEASWSMRRLADQGDAIAQRNLGVMHLEGEGVSIDYAEAMIWFRKAADQGDAIAQFNIGKMHHDGLGVMESIYLAEIWYRKAAEQGLAVAQHVLGLMLNERRISPNYPEAAKWFCKAADQGNARSQLLLGGMYFSGRGVSKDYSEAMKWYRKAADQGDALSLYLIGMLYRNGQGVAVDHVESTRWIGKAAEAGIEDAQLEFGLAYLRGQGVPKDSTEAEKWLRKAVEQGNAEARGWLRSLSVGGNL